MFLRKLKIGSKMFLGFGIVMLLMLGVIGNSYINFLRQSNAVELNLNTYEVISESDGILISLINMETGIRGYVVTGDEKFLDPYNQGKIDYEKHYNNLKELTLDNTKHQQQLVNIQDYYNTWLQWQISEIIGGRQKVSAGQLSMEDLIAIAQTSKGKTEMDKIRGVLSEINNEEQSRLQTRNNDRIKMESQTKVIMTLGAALSTILAVIIASLVIRIVVNPVKTVTNTFRKISEDDVDLEVRLKVNSEDELGDMSKYFNRFMKKLKELILENQNQNWLKTGQAELSEEIRGKQDIETLGANIIRFVTKRTNAQIGAIYFKTDENKYKLLSTYAYSKYEGIASEFKLGEGIIGQCALEKHPIVIKSIPEDYIKITSGMGGAVPKSILAIPCLYHDKVECVIELGSFSELTDLQLKFIDQVSESIAASISFTKAQLKMRELLDKTLVQSEELQAQQEELRQNNEELEEQAKALRQSESNLQSQQEELRVINEELEEKTKSLQLQKNDIVEQNYRLNVAQIEIEEKARAIESANKYKSEFLANMSHELRTPLNSILVLSQMLATKKDNTPLTNKQLEYAKTIHSSGQDLLSLINDVLDISKVEAGKMEVNLDKINLRELATYIRASFEPIAMQRGLNFEIKIEEGLPESIVSDSQRIQQVINNLLSNAFKFTHEGEVVMTFRQTEGKNTLDNEASINKSISIAVTDTGIGIPLDKQQLIFEPFKQSDGTTSRKYGGTGLGLSISKELVELLGGTIHLKSYEDKGSTFTIIIPDKSEESTKLKEQVQEEKNNIDSFIIGKKKINSIKNEKIIKPNSEEDKGTIKDNEKLLLIIEDDRRFLNLLSELAKEKGYKVLVAGNGQEGINLAVKYKPKAIVLDIGLPDINGWEVIDALKENKDTEDIPVHVISGKEKESNHKNMEGLIGYLKKPVNLEELYGMFNNVEDSGAKPFKKLLVVDGQQHKDNNILNTLSRMGVEVSILENGLEAYNILKVEKFDCIILDLKLKDMNGIEFLDKLEKENMINFPVLIHTEKGITQEEEQKLKKYAKSIIIKGSRSVERLVDEASLFLHEVDSKMEKEKIKAIKLNHEKEDSLKDKKVLIVDDDMRNVFALTSALEEKGIIVVVGRNGKEGIEKFHENTDIDLILMDVMMPEMDGYDAMREIRRDEKLSRVPIIAITAKAMKDDRQKCIEAGADDYLTKPIEMNKLISLLRVWLYK